MSLPRDATEQGKLDLWDWIRQRPKQWLPTGDVYVFALTPEQRGILLQALSPFTSESAQLSAAESESGAPDKPMGNFTADDFHNALGTPSAVAGKTPRTDFEVSVSDHLTHHADGGWVRADFARSLELEIASLRSSEAGKTEPAAVEATFSVDSYAGSG